MEYFREVTLSANRMLKRLRPLLAASVFLVAAGPIADAADFNGDGKQDIVWRAHSGKPVVWQMDGLTPASRATLPTAPDAASAIVGAGKFFSGGAGGILWINSSHELSLWGVSNGAITQSCVVASGIDAGWSLLGIGDLDGNGIDDVLWRLPNGTVNAYLMNGCVAPATITLNATANAAWTFAGIGTVADNQNHPKGGVFWRDSNGDVILWRLNGTSVFSKTLSAGAYATWSVGAIADFDGDGFSDILWHDAGGTQAALWVLSGTQFTASAISASASGVFAAADAIFVGGFDSSARPAPALTAAWTILGAADFNGDGRADVLLADAKGDSAIWQMQGAAVQATSLIAPTGDMPYTGLSGWRMALDRPSITKVDNQVSVTWNPISGPQHYVVYASSANEPAATGVQVPTAAASLSFGRSDSGYADKRYFAVGATYHGVQLPAGPEAYIVEYVSHVIPLWGAMALADINGDGCVDVLYALGDCHGNFAVLNSTTMGLAALGATGREYRDLRYADFDGDGIIDLVSNVYSDIDDTASQVLFFRGTGNDIHGVPHFVEDTAFTNLQIRGHGETVVVADFNNDGYLDIFLPNYSMDSPDEHSWLLINDGAGHFTDVSDLTGTAADPTATVALRAVPSNCRVEGAQAVDINGDGRIDLYVASHLFINQGNDSNGVPHFADLGPRVSHSNFTPATFPYYNCIVTTPSPAGLPLLHDEGAKFFDMDNSGQLTLLVDGAESPEEGGDGVSLYKFDGIGNFVDHSDAFPQFYMADAWGIQAVDVDGDGLPDIVLSGGCDPSFDPTPANSNCVVAGNPHVPPHLLVNRGGQFVAHDFYQDGLAPNQVTWFDAPAAVDFDLNGTMDLVLRSNSLTTFTNQASSFDTIIVSIVGTNDEHNQAGRVVRMSPALKPGVVMTQIVDGGSGYLANNQYDLTFATPYPGAYAITVRFANGSYTATAHAGDHVTMRANGTYLVQ